MLKLKVAVIDDSTDEVFRDGTNLYTVEFPLGESLPKSMKLLLLKLIHQLNQEGRADPDQVLFFLSYLVSRLCLKAIEK
jgi:hypothetical protein